MAELSAVRRSVDAARTKATEAVARATRDLGKRRELFSETRSPDGPDAFQKSLDSIRAGTTSANAAAKTACDALEAALDGGYGRARVCVAESRGNDDPGDSPPVTHRRRSRGGRGSVRVRRPERSAARVVARAPLRPRGARRERPFLPGVPRVSGQIPTIPAPRRFVSCGASPRFAAPETPTR